MQRPALRPVNPDEQNNYARRISGETSTLTSPLKRPISGPTVRINEKDIEANRPTTSTFPTQAGIPNTRESIFEKVPPQGGPISYLGTVLPPLEDEDEYKTAGIDEVEFEVKDLIRLQKANARSGDSYDDILSSTNLPRQHLTHHSPSISSSSTLNNLMPVDSQRAEANIGSGAEETVTETVKTQQVQTTFRQIGQYLGDSAFFIPLSSAITHHDGQQNDDRKIIVPLSTSIRHEEHPVLQHL